ncbi:MAG: DUF4271 domain-containing protein [Prevotella sp.]|nr:DUF4271 domain-containing protein [Prevotella sp.]
MDYNSITPDSLLTTAAFHADNIGVEGIPIPYALHDNNALALTLFACFAVLVVSVSKSRRFIIRQTKNLFFPPYTEQQVSETSGEFHLQFLVTIVGCVLTGIGTYLFAIEYMNLPQPADSYQLIVQLTGIYAAYLLAKWGIYSIVNQTFFGSKRNLHWIRYYLFMAAAGSVLLFPAILLQVYFDISIKTIVIYFGFILILNKMLTFYQCWLIFFKQNGLFLQIFLYFCALEIMPLLALAGIVLSILH